MKNFITIRVILSVLCLSPCWLFSSCDDFLTKTPGNQPSEINFWKTLSDAESWMYGIYNGVLVALSNSPGIVQYGDMRTDNLYPTGYGNSSSMQLNLLKASYSECNWNKLYTVINRCNVAIEKIPAMSLSDIDRNLLLGQCHGIRAMFYFYIVRLWGDAPLILESWDGAMETKYNSRTPVEEVAAAIESDIVESIRMLTGGSGTSTLTGVYYFNLATAYVLQADFLAWRGRYSEIPLVYDNINRLGKYELVSEVRDWNYIFSDPTNSTETIFTLKWSKVNYPTSDRSYYANQIGFGTSNPQYRMSEEWYINMIRDTLDIRFWGVIKRSQIPGQLSLDNPPMYDASSYSVNQYYKYWPLGKEKGTFETSSTEFFFDMPVYRYADIVLLYAEALNRIGDDKGALDVVNTLRASRGCTTFAYPQDYPDQLGNTPGSREKLIMDERQLEFVMEGKRWFDLLRTDWMLEVLDDHVRYMQLIRGDEVVGFTEERFLLWPINISVITANPNIKQNSGYE